MAVTRILATTILSLAETARSAGTDLPPPGATAASVTFRSRSQPGSQPVYRRAGRLIG